MKVTLISLYILESNGIRYLASSLRKSGYEVDEIYLEHFIHHRHRPPSEKTIKMLVSLIQERGSQLVGISLRAGAYLSLATELTRRIEKDLGIRVIWGGAHVTLAPDQCFENHGLLMLGEAERTIVNVVSAIDSGKDLTEIPGAWIKNNERVVQNPPAPLIQDLDSIPFPDFTSVDNKFWIHNEKVIPGEPIADERIFRIMASRGCPYNCSFCGVSAFRRVYDKSPNFYRIRSVQNVMLELEQAKNNFKNLNKIRFDDELFVPDKKWLSEFAKEYKKRISLPFDILSNPRCMDEWTIDTLSEAGVVAVFMGVQGTASSNERLYNRYVADQKVIKVAKEFRKRDIKGMFQVLIDDPLTTHDEQQMLLKLLLEIPRPYELFIYSLCHWPGSKRTDELLEKGLIDPADVEGCNDKVLRQFNADFTYERTPADALYLALFMLANKRGVPKSLIRWIERTKWFSQHPKPVKTLAVLVNIAKIFSLGIKMVLKGDISIHLARRWLSRQSPSSLPSV